MPDTLSNHSHNNTVNIVTSSSSATDNNIFQEYLDSPYALALCSNFHYNLPCDHDCYLAHPCRRVRVYHHQRYHQDMVICCKMFLLYGDCSCFTLTQCRSNKMAATGSAGQDATTPASVGCDLFYHPPTHVRDLLRVSALGLSPVSTAVSGTLHAEQQSPSRLALSKTGAATSSTMEESFKKNKATVDVVVQTVDSSFGILPGLVPVPSALQQQQQSSSLLLPDVRMGKKYGGSASCGRPKVTAASAAAASSSQQNNMDWLTEIGRDFFVENKAKRNGNGKVLSPTQQQQPQALLLQQQQQQQQQASSGMWLQSDPSHLQRYPPVRPELGLALLSHLVNLAEKQKRL